MQAGVKERYDAFADACATNGHNATQAAITAGYSKKGAKGTAYKLQTIPYVKDKIAEIKEELRLKAEATREGVCQRLRTMERIGLEMKTLGGLNSAIKCVELDGKTSALFIDRTQSDTTEERKALDKAQEAETRKVAQILNLQDAKKGA